MIKTICFLMVSLAAFSLISCNNQASTALDAEQISKVLVCEGDSDCTTSGCSGTGCQHKGEENLATTCEWLDEYHCYKNISCGCTEGKCQWKTDAAFDHCIEEARRPDCAEDSDCTTSGCSGTICQSKNKELSITTCEWLPRYACYKNISCGCTEGNCEWKTDAVFYQCIKDAH